MTGAVVPAQPRQAVTSIWEKVSFAQNQGVAKSWSPPKTK